MASVPIRDIPRDARRDRTRHFYIDPERVTKPAWTEILPKPENAKGLVSTSLEPIAPRLNAPAAFLTDDRAISYAETVMGIVEHFKLAVIAGLPDGATIARTGMKVFKHDDSQQHGVGILPTVLVTRTRQNIAEGKDEVLLRAVEVLKR